MIVRDEGYKEYIRNRGCCVPGCRTSRVDPAHVETAGKSIKGSDASCIPLCRRHHDEYHSKGVRSFERAYHVDVAAEIAKALHRWAFGVELRLPASLESKAFE